MSAKQDSKTAASSTPAAAPAGSPPQERKPAKPAATPVAAAAQADQGADPEIGQEDILAALGQLSDAQDQAKDDDAAAEAAPARTAEPADEAGDEAAEGAEPATAEAPAAESEEQAGASGEAAAEDSGDVATEEEQPAGEQAEAEGEEPAGKKPSPHQQRYNELTARAKTAEADLAQERERSAALQAELAGRTGATPLEHVDSLDQLAQERQRIVALHQKLLRSPQGVELPDPAEKGRTVQYDAEGVANLLAQTFALLHEAIPARDQFLRERSSHDATAVNAYPWMKDTRSGAGAQVQALLQQNPGLRRIGPHYRLVAADSLVGQTLREAGIQVTPELIARLRPKAGSATPAKSPAAAAAPRKTPPPAPRGAGVVPARQSPRSQQGSAADKRLKSGDGNVNDLAASIAANL